MFGGASHALKVLLVTVILPLVALFSFPSREAVLPPASSTANVSGAVSETVPPPIMPGSQSDAANGANAANEPSLAVINGCLNRAGESGACLDGLFREFLKSHTTADALALIQRYESEDTGLRLSCHPVVHAVGRETFRQKGTVHDAFTACDQTCHSGCYHGAMERFIRGSAASDDEAGHISQEELRAKAAVACDPSEATRFRFQCLHGLGHALMFFSDYRLKEALGSCDVLADPWSRSSCYGGLFMENVFSATPEKRDLSPTDYHYPCSALDMKYKSDCYMMQTTRMSEMGLNTTELFAECRRAGDYQYICMQSIGRDLSNDARIGDPKPVAAKCELGQGEERRACTRGVAYALLDNTWDGRYAFPFCASFRSNEDMSHCFAISESYLKATYAKTSAELGEDCRKYASRAKLCFAEER